MIFLIAAAVAILSSVYYGASFTDDIDKVFLSISTFLFSILTGFFISRQASRFNKVRETVTRFDGMMSSVYRAAGHIDADLQKEIGSVIVAHYERILSTGKWNIHFMEKSSTLQSMHELLEKHVKEEAVTKLANQAIGRVLWALSGCQDARKQMLALQNERVTAEQWVLISFFALMLVGTASAVSSVGDWFPSILKAAFVISIGSVLFILYRLNALAFTERIMGERSAEDVLGIINGTK